MGATLAAGPRSVILDHAKAEALLSDLSFYTRCPEFLFLRGAAIQVLEAQRRANDAKLGGGPPNAPMPPRQPPHQPPQPGCKSCSQNATSLEPIIRAFTEHLVLMKQVLPETGMDRFREYARDKLSCDKLVFFHRTPRGPVKLEL